MVADAHRAPRVAVLWPHLSGYLHASLSALHHAGVDVRVVHRAVEADAPFDPEAITAGLSTVAWSGTPDREAIAADLEAFAPDALLVCSWDNGVYRKLARSWRGRALRILAMDNQWWATPKQRAGVAISRFAIRPSYDAALVADERGAVFAGKLGYPAERLIWGMNTGDHERFAAVAEQRGDELPPAAFLFIGRLVPDKAIDVLAAGYARYRSLVDDPWPLLVAGTGPDERLLADRDGVELLGFVQPADLPKVVEQAGCLVLPSRFEPWAVVIHEATAAGLPVVCTRVCGASTRLVLDGYNGVVVTPDDAPALAGALRRIHRAGDAERRAMGAASRSLALQYSPERWAQNLLRRLPDLREQVGLTPAPWLVSGGSATSDRG